MKLLLDIVALLMVLALLTGWVLLKWEDWQKGRSEPKPVYMGKPAFKVQEPKPYDWTEEDR